MAERSTGARQSDEEILAALDAAPGAFAVFFRRHVAELLDHFLSRTHDSALAADLCAETFAAALDGAHRFNRSRGSAAAWLFQIAERELAHAERVGTARDRARRRLGLAALVPARDAPAGLAVPASGGGFVSDLDAVPASSRGFVSDLDAVPASGGGFVSDLDAVPASGGGFVSDLEEELVAAARYRAERRSRPPVLPRPSPAALRGGVAVGAALALGAIVAAIVLQGGNGGTLAGERSAAALPPTATFRLPPMQPLAPCGQPASEPLVDGGPIPGISLLGRPQRDADALPLDPGLLPIGSFDPRSARRATHTRLWSTVHVVPSLDVAVDGRCGSRDGPGLCLVADEREFACFAAADVEGGRALARTSAYTVVGLVPDGVDRVTIYASGPPVGAEVVENVYEAQLDDAPGSQLEVAFSRPEPDGCRRTVAADLLAQVAVLRDQPRPSHALPRAARDAFAEWEWSLDAVVESGARFWGRSVTVDFWAVPVVPRGAAECAPATRVCIVAVSERSGAWAHCVLGRNRDGEDWVIAGLLRDHAVIFGVVPDGVTGARVTRRGATVEVDAHDNVFGGVLPFPYRVRDQTRVELLREDAAATPLVGIVDAGGPVDDIVGQLRARGYETLDEITPGGTLQPRSIVYWWPGRATLEEAFEVAGPARADEVAPIDDTERIPRPVLDTDAPVVVVVGTG
jgi:hypothetical protein